MGTKSEAQEKASFKSKIFDRPGPAAPLSSPHPHTARVGPRMRFFFVFFLVFLYVYFPGAPGEKEKGEAYYDRLCRSVDRIMDMLKSPPTLPWPFGPHVAGYQRVTHTPPHSRSIALPVPSVLTIEHEI